MSWFFLLHLPFHTFRIIIIFFNCSLYTVHTKDLVDFHFGFLASIYRLLMPSFCRCVHCHPELSSNSQNKHLPRSDNENHLNQLFTTWPNFRITLFLALFFSLHRFLLIYFMVIFFFISQSFSDFKSHGIYGSPLVCLVCIDWLRIVSSIFLWYFVEKIMVLNVEHCVRNGWIIWLSFGRELRIRWRNKITPTSSMVFLFVLQICTYIQMTLRFLRNGT